MIPRHLLIALALLLIAIFGMGFYALHLRSVAETHQQRLQDLRPVPPPVAGPAQRVTLFVADDSDGLLHQREVAVALPPTRASARAKSCGRWWPNIWRSRRRIRSPKAPISKTCSSSTATLR